MKTEELKKTEPVELTLEESGNLCFLILSALKDVKPKDISGNTIADAVGRSYVESLKTAHQKIAAANDKMMGKS